MIRLLGYLLLLFLLFKGYRLAGRARFSLPGLPSLELQTVFFEATFVVMGVVAAVDGTVNAKTVKAAEKMMHHLGLQAEMLTEAMHLFRQGTESRLHLDQIVADFNQMAAQNRPLKQFFLDLQWQVAQKSGPVSSQKKMLLALISQQLNVWIEKHTAPVDPLQAAYRALDIQAHATNEAVKAQYRRLMNQYHPDKLSARGLSAGMLQLAQEKTQTIREAYDLIRHSRNFR